MKEEKTMRLKFPPRDSSYYTSAPAERRAADGSSFQAEFRNAMDNAFAYASEKCKLTYYGQPTPADYQRGANQFSDEMFRQINNRMVDYLIEHDGVIDGWSFPESNLVIRVGGNENYSYNYNYFSDRYVLDGEGLKRASNEMRNPSFNYYPYPEDPRIAEVKQELNQKSRTVNEMSDYVGFWGFIRKTIARLPIILGVLFVITCLIFHFGGIDPDATSKAMMEASKAANNGAPSMLASLGEGILMLVSMICGLAVEKGLGAFCLGLVIPLVVTGIASLILGKMFTDKKFKKSAYKAAVAERDACKKEYNNLKKEEEARRNLFMQVTADWNREYFEFLKAKGYKVN